MRKLVLLPLLLWMFFGAGLLARSSEIDPREIVTLLPPDVIPAILEPEHISIGEAGKFMNNGHRVLGVSINGESRAYPINILSSHEIANDFVGGVKIAVTW